jgi:tRNA (guanine37-N1)-methyltransferase
MKIAVITLFPGMLEALTGFGVSGRAVDQGMVSLEAFNPRDYTTDKHRTVDARPYGGGPGMLMMVEPLLQALEAARTWMGEDQHLVIYLSPQGRLLQQEAVNRCVERAGIIFIAGRYEGIDERFISLEVDEEWSIGDYVLSGGELAAMVVADALIRQIPEVLGSVESAQQDSFSQGLLDCPHYTRPEEVSGLKVPPVLLSGDHAAIRRWRLRQSLLRTTTRRPDLMMSLILDNEQQAFMDEIDNELANDE